MYMLGENQTVVVIYVSTRFVARAEIGSASEGFG